MAGQRYLMPFLTASKIFPWKKPGAYFGEKDIIISLKATGR
jgi:hypothetical protein